MTTIRLNSGKTSPASIPTPRKAETVVHHSMVDGSHYSLLHFYPKAGVSPADFHD